MGNTLLIVVVLFDGFSSSCLLTSVGLSLRKFQLMVTVMVSLKKCRFLPAMLIVICLCESEEKRMWKESRRNSKV